MRKLRDSVVRKWRKKLEENGMRMGKKKKKKRVKVEGVW